MLICSIVSNRMLSFKMDWKKVLYYKILSSKVIGCLPSTMLLICTFPCSYQEFVFCYKFSSIEDNACNKMFISHVYKHYHGGFYFIKILSYHVPLLQICSQTILRHSLLTQSSNLYLSSRTMWCQETAVFFEIQPTDMHQYNHIFGLLVTL